MTTAEQRAERVRDRVAEIAFRIRQRYPDAKEQVYVVWCDRCGIDVRDVSIEHLIPQIKNWYIGTGQPGDGDYCHICRQEVNV